MMYGKIGHNWGENVSEQGHDDGGGGGSQKGGSPPMHCQCLCGCM